MARPKKLLGLSAMITITARRVIAIRHTCATGVVTVASFLREDLHKTFSDELLGLKLSEQRKEEFLGALRVVWEQDVSIVVSRAGLLERRLADLKTERSKALRMALNNNFNEDDTKAVLNDIDTDIAQVEDDLKALKDVESDFVEFVEFSIDFIENLRERFWELDAEHLGWCKQLLFPQGFSVSRDKKVYTPKVSDFYRLINTQKDPEGSSESNMVGVEGFEPPTSSTSMRRY